MINIQKVSIIGRVAIGIACLEHMLPETKYPKTLSILLSFLNKFIYDPNIVIDEWEELSAEIIPDVILNMSYSEDEFVVISQSEYLDFEIFYQEVGEKCCLVIDKIVEIAGIHFYTSILSYSPETVKLTQDILNICETEVGSIPNIILYKECKFNKNNGWGVVFQKENKK